MPLEQVIQLGRTTIEYAILTALPLLAVATLVSVVINILQVLTSIQDQTLTYVPRLIVVGLVIVVTLSYSLQLATHFTVRMIEFAAGVMR